MTSPQNPVPLPNGAANRPRIGGSFAPPLPPERLRAYRDLADNPETPPPVADALRALAAMVEAYHNLPRRARAAATPHPSGLGQIVLLAQEEVQALWQHVPWPHECEGIQTLFDEIPPEKKELRDAAFHLLWMAKELTIDREPLTTDSLGLPE